MADCLIRDRGGLRSRGGGLRAPGGGFCRIPSNGVSYSLDTLTYSDVASILGKSAPTYFWDAAVASGADETVSGTDNLSDVDSPTKQVTDAILGGDCTTLIGSTADAMVAASATPADVLAETVTGILIMRYTEAASGTVRGVLSKRDTAAGNNGYEIYSQSRNVSVIFDTASGVSSRVIAADHGTANAQVILFTRSVAGNVTNVYSREGSSTGGANNASLTSTVAFALGASALRSSNPGFNIAKAMLWIGTVGDGFGETERSALAVALGLE